MIITLIQTVFNQLSDRISQRLQLDAIDIQVTIWYPTDNSVEENNSELYSFNIIKK